MPQRRRIRHHKHELMKGGLSFSDIANKLYSGVQSIHGALKKYKPASTILKLLPQTANVPYLGSALTFGREYLGYGATRHRKSKK